MLHHPYTWLLNVIPTFWNFWRRCVPWRPIQIMWLSYHRRQFFEYLFMAYFIYVSEADEEQTRSEHYKHKYQAFGHSHFWRMILYCTTNDVWPPENR